MVWSKKNSIIFLHDCLPFNMRMTRRNPRAGTESGGAWTGDVWKVLPILRKYRPDLSVHALDCPPTGLVMITGLDPKSTALGDAIFKIIDEFKESADDEAQLRALRKSITQISTKSINTISDLAKYCW